MNEQTAVNNYFQENLDIRNALINERAQAEFDTFVEKLREAGVRVIVEQDIKEFDTPDSIFPNNWVSFHENGTVVLYPMFAENRRRERREEIMDRIEDEGFYIHGFMDYTSAEEAGVFLEGTGSILMDRVNQIAYCALSPRADESLFIEFCEDFECDPVVFNAYQSVDGERLPIYHTNVMMALGEHLAVICLNSIDDNNERKLVLKMLDRSNKEVLEITQEQMHQFAGNMLEVRGSEGSLMVMSTAAFKSLRPDQIEVIEKHSKILHSDLETIETCGGGSARCMMAEVFLPKESLG